MNNPALKQSPNEELPPPVFVERIIQEEGCFSSYLDESHEIEPLPEWIAFASTQWKQQYLPPVGLQVPVALPIDGNGMAQPGLPVIQNNYPPVPPNEVELSSQGNNANENPFVKMMNEPGNPENLPGIMQFAKANGPGPVPTADNERSNGLIPQIEEKLEVSKEGGAPFNPEITGELTIEEGDLNLGVKAEIPLENQPLQDPPVVEPPEDQ